MRLLTSHDSAGSIFNKSIKSCRIFSSPKLVNLQTWVSKLLRNFPEWKKHERHNTSMWVLWTPPKLQKMLQMLHCIYIHYIFIYTYLRRRYDRFEYILFFWQRQKNYISGWSFSHGTSCITVAFLKRRTMFQLEDVWCNKNRQYTSLWGTYLRYCMKKTAIFQTSAMK